MSDTSGKYFFPDLGSIDTIYPILVGLNYPHFRNNKGLDRKLEARSETYRNTWFINVWDVTSEMLLAAVCGESEFDITFDSHSTKHDYDFIANGYPVQVKTPNKPYGSFQAAVDAKKKRKKDVDDSKITYDLVVNDILNLINHNIGSIDDALTQGAKIVFLNGSANDAGSYFSQYCIETEKFFSMKKVMNQSLGLLSNTDCFVPLIFCATAFRLIYYINMLAFQVPIIIIDRQKRVDKDKEIKLLHCHVL